MNGNAFSAAGRKLLPTRRTWAGLAVLLVGLGVTGCSKASVAEEPEPATVREISEGLSEITVTERAAERLGIETEAVGTAAVDGGERLVVPYSALMYHYDGSTWTYAETAAFTYQRVPVQVERIADGMAMLTEGPAQGSSVVSVGAAELYGIEFGIGK